MKSIALCLIAVFQLGCSTGTLLQREPANSGLNSGLKTRYMELNYGEKFLAVRVGIQNPSRPILGDILYIHGFADRLDNHGPLFDEWARKGFRVISFDLPSHGEDRGTYNDLNHFSFEDLAELAAHVERFTKPDVRRPLILSGWSTGGLLVVRMLQKGWVSGLSRPVSAVILFAPGVSVRKFPWTFGNRLGEVTEATLTHDPAPPHSGPIEPSSPFWSRLILYFSPVLLLNSGLSQEQSYPVSVPTLVFSGGDEEDMYAKSWVIRSWVDDQNLLRKSSGEPRILSIQCPHAMHELDNELPEFGGAEVRRTAAIFAASALKGETELWPSKDSFGSICRRVDQ